MRSTQPTLAAIKLAWWRERLEQLDDGLVPAEPRFEDAARELLPRGVSGADLAGLEEGWAACLDAPPDLALVTEHGARLFALGARLLGVPFEDGTIGAAGRVFAGVDVGRRRIVDLVPGEATMSRRIAKSARPLTGLAALAARDLRRAGSAFEPEATPGRSWTLLRHRLTGRI